MNKGYYLILFICLNQLVCFGQAPAGDLKSTLNTFISQREKLPVEKLYLQTDKAYYTTGDTLHFKAYLLNGDFLTPALKSGLLYIEFDNAENKVAKRIMVKIGGTSWGDIPLNTKELPNGVYTMRAYTNWMRNFGEDYVFKKNIYLSSLSNEVILVNSRFELQKRQNNITIQASLRLTGLNKEPLRFKDMRFWVKDALKTLYRGGTATGLDGSMGINFNLSDNVDPNKLVIQLQDAKAAETTLREYNPTMVDLPLDPNRLAVPVVLNRSENTDLQFMPEGGHLVVGLPTRVGFKALGEDGKGITVKGEIYNSKQQLVTTFQSLYNGMGSFELNPQADENYTARVQLTGNVIKNYALPPVNIGGTNLNVSNRDSDSLTVALGINPNLLNRAFTYHLIGQARGLVCYAAAVDFSNKKYITLKVAKRFFPAGIARFSLLDVNNKPLNERIVYIDQQQENLQISLQPDKPAYSIRDSIALTISVTDKTGKPIAGSFSLAVTDDSQVKADSLSGNIINNLLFTSDLKGTVEDPGYYFDNNGKVNKYKELDNLLLTQGWVGYDWAQLFLLNAVTPSYNVEEDFVIKGKVINVFKKPIANTKVLIYSRRPLMLRDTVSDKNGLFIFKDIIPIDTALFKIQATNKNGKSFNVGLVIDEFKEPAFTPSLPFIPWYINSDTTLLNQANTRLQQLNAEDNYKGDGRLLKEVIINDKKIVKGSHNLNGPGGADFVLDEKELFKYKRMTLKEIMAKYKFKQRVFYIIDGQFMDALGIPRDEYLNYITAGDIKGIEIMNPGKYAVAYGNRGIYVEITTYSGNGAFMKHLPGTSLFKPLAFSLPKQFYRPRYTSESSSLHIGTDLRSTIHWEPNVLTDTAGKATVSFYSADLPATYTLIVEGIGLDGELGYLRKQIKVTSKTNAIK